jgi:hypothetical protein
MENSQLSTRTRLQLTLSVGVATVRGVRDPSRAACGWSRRRVVGGVDAVVLTQVFCGRTWAHSHTEKVEGCHTVLYGGKQPRSGEFCVGNKLSLLFASFEVKPKAKTKRRADAVVGLSYVQPQ